MIRHKLVRQLKSSEGAGIRRQWMLPLALSAALTPLMIGCVGTPASVNSPAPASTPHLEVTPASVNFSAIVGEPSSQTLKISNSGTGSLTVSKVSATGSGLTVSGFAGSVVLAAGASTSVNVQLNPTAAGPVTGSVSIVTSSPVSGTTLPVSGEIAKANLALTVGPTSVSFGTVTGITTAKETVVLTNTGNASVTVTKIAVKGAGFAVSAASVPLTLASSQSATVNVDFIPTAAGSYTGTLTVASNATNATVAVPLSGQDVASPTNNSHWVGLNWNSSTSVVSGYNVYRGTAANGPFTRLNASLVTGLSYADELVTAGDTYFYVTTAVNGSGEESAYSNAAEAIVP